MQDSQTALLLICLVVLSSGCISNITGSSKPKICEADISTDYMISSEGFQWKERDIYGADTETTVSGNISFPNELPEGIDEEEALDKLELTVEIAGEDVEHITRSGKRKQVCNATINSDEKTYSCSFQTDPIDSYIYIDRNFEGCDSGGASGTDIKFVRVIEDNEFGNDRFYLNFSTPKVESREDGWKKMRNQIYLENKDIGANEAPEGIGITIAAVNSKGHRLGSIGEISRVLKGYSEYGSGGLEIREDQEIAYLYFHRGNEGDLPDLAFKNN